MNLKCTVLTGILLLIFLSSSGQPDISGFVRSGAYAGFDRDKDRFYVSSAFSDFFLKTDYAGERFKAYAELQYRYGTEFLETVNYLRLREGYVIFYGNKWDFSAGQKIIRWGRADFTNPTSRLTPRNFLLRSPDREEINTGNLVAEINVYPSERLRLQAVAVPLYSSSVLSIDPIPLPSYVSIGLIDSLITRGAFSYGLKADLYLKGIDIGISWFDGYDPMPGIALSRFELHDVGGFPFPVIGLSARPYRNRVAGIDFETYAGPFGIRGETAWSVPEGSFKTSEYIPLPFIDFVAGSDWAGGKWRLSVEYYGRWMYEFIALEIEPLIGTEPDLSAISQLLVTPGFDFREYVRGQTGSFNRLYNYQLERFYHSAGLRAETDLAYGKIIPSVFTMYNLTSGDLLVIPEIRYKPADGLTIVGGAEFYRGKEGSLYRIIDDFMNNIYLGLRADF